MAVHVIQRQLPQNGIQSVARDGAVVTFAYLGDPQRLQNDLLQRGVALGEEPQAGWVLRSAVSAAGVP